MMAREASGGLPCCDCLSGNRRSFVFWKVCTSQSESRQAKKIITCFYNQSVSKEASGKCTIFLLPPSQEVEMIGMYHIPCSASQSGKRKASGKSTLDVASKQEKERF